MAEYDTNSYKLYTQKIEAKLNKAVKALELAIKYKAVIDRCQHCTEDLNSET